MAKVSAKDGLQDRPTRKPRGMNGRVRAYPWDLWLDGRLWYLTQGEDFECSMGSFKALVTNQRGRRQLRIHVRKVDDRTYAIQSEGHRLIPRKENKDAEAR